MEHITKLTMLKRSGGNTLKLLKDELTLFQPTIRKARQKILEATLDTSKKAQSFMDKYEEHYFNIFKENLTQNPDKAFESFNLQQYKVINGLPIYKIPAYIGYRQSFGKGADRYGVEAKPVFALLEPVSSCNIKCPFCFQSDASFTTKEYMGIMNYDFAIDIINQINDLKIRGITIASRGEPLLNKHLPDILDYIKTRTNILEIKLNTNAKLLNKKILNRIISSSVNIFVVSTDHYVKEKYELFRKGAVYEDFIENISAISDSIVKVGRSDDLYTRASGVHADPEMDSSMFKSFYSNYFDEVGLVSVAERWDTYNNQPSDRDDVCGQPFEKLYIWQDGVMNPCDADYKSYLTPGNVKSISLAEGWANLEKLRSDMLKGHRTKNIPCDRCGQS